MMDNKLGSKMVKLKSFWNEMISNIKATIRGFTKQRDIETIQLEKNEAGIFSLPEETLLKIFSYVNQIDATNIRLVNKKLYRIGTIKLFGSIFLDRPELKEAEIKKKVTKSKYNYSAFQTSYTVINGYDKFQSIWGMKEMKLVNNVLIYSSYKNKTFDDCYSFLIKKCSWITVDVDSYSSDIFYEQFYRINKISYLRIQDSFKFSANIKDNFSIKELHIHVCKNQLSNPLLLIPQMKCLTFLHVIDTANQNVLGEFQKLKITNLKVKKLGFEVLQLSIKEIGEVFQLNEIISLKLHFFNKITPYEDLKYLDCMDNLRSIEIIWDEASFENIMEQFIGRTFHSVQLHSYGNKVEDIADSRIVKLLHGFEQSIMYFSLCTGNIGSTGMSSRYIQYNGDSPFAKRKDAKALKECFPRKNYTNLTTFSINANVYRF
ncbi:hypothetical protein JA1_001883 [Spathaspora sp. JA1]|nr:hypothetical protein JA1_001883 [Spathaspora sp. JA1]